MGLPLRLSC